MAVLTGAVMASAQEISSASERIVNQEPLKNVSAGDWRIPRPDMVQVMEGGKDNALFTLSYKEDHGGLNHSMFPYVYGKNPLLNTAVLSLHLPPEKYREYNQLSCMVYPDVAERAALWFEVGGSGIWTQACRPLRPRQWNRISICWSNHTPEQAEKIKTAFFPARCSTAQGIRSGQILMSRFRAGEGQYRKLTSGRPRRKKSSAADRFFGQLHKRAFFSGSQGGDTCSTLERRENRLPGKNSAHHDRNEPYKTADSRGQNSGVYRLKSRTCARSRLKFSYHQPERSSGKNRHFFCV